MKMQAQIKKAEDLKGQLKAQKQVHTKQAYEFQNLNKYL